jgi:hypothetical protein
VNPTENAQKTRITRSLTTIILRNNQKTKKHSLPH